MNKGVNEYLEFKISALEMENNALRERILYLENLFTAPEPEPACKQNQEWMLEVIDKGKTDLSKDFLVHTKEEIDAISKEAWELECDARLWDAVQDYEETK